MPQGNSARGIQELVLGHFREDLVALDLQENRFSIIPNLPLARINEFLANRGQHDSALAAALQEHGLLEKTIHIRGELGSHINEGLFETRWDTPFIEFSRAEPLLLWKAAHTLWRVGLTLKSKGYAGVIKLLQNTQPGPQTAHTASYLQRLMAHLNRVFILDFSNNKCLAYSLALCVLARRVGLDARLIIGVRTRPFSSHAWVEFNGAVVNDDPELRQKLAVILEL
ncbi:lasso peptide biosynthesis B2 protein [Achromobacter sp. RTa]|uniref:lasso peptide biosynthesis B2 protein n=1 Tax=Achromobacter sp. RTa TaxID=1532557 RepID=UPI0009DE001C|nr:lasso peptide biosynthesis B2 protein [Achromobacter sp. RTa]